MCYVLLLSTTSDTDLTVHNNNLVRFSNELPPIAETNQLQYSQKWYIGSKSVCSCSFRHLYSIDLGFGDPVDWYPEDPEEIEATLQLIRIIRELVVSDYGVDCIDAWEHQERNPVVTSTLEVDLASVKDTEFRFFENHHFTFSTSS